MNEYVRALANDLLLIEVEIEKVLRQVIRPVDIVLCLDDDGIDVHWTVWLADCYTPPNANVICGHTTVDVDATTAATTLELLNQCLQQLAARPGSGSVP